MIVFLINILYNTVFKESDNFLFVSITVVSACKGTLDMMQSFLKVPLVLLPRKKNKIRP